MNKTNLRANLRVGDILIDILTLTLAYLIAYFTTSAHLHFAISNWYAGLLFSYCVVFILFMCALRMYHMSNFFYLTRIVKNTVISLFGTSVVVFLFLFMTYNTRFSRLFLLVFISLSTILLNAEKLLVLKAKSNLTLNVKVIYAGEPDMFGDFLYCTRMSGFNFDILGYIDIRGVPIKGVKRLGHIGDFERILKNNPCEQVIFTQSLSSASFIEPYLKIADEMGIVIRIVLDTYKLDISRNFISSLGPYPMITYHSIVLDKLSLTIKRCVDIVGALTGILLTAPIMLLTAVAIKLDSPGPPVFSQVRVGCNGQKFKIYKFRSMYLDAEARKAALMDQNQMGDSRLFKIKDDPRITSVGRFIRKTSIDEIPQFFNVLLGNMSLVGTRPPTEDEVAQYDRPHWRRISMKPGITGVWQTSGRNEITDFEEIVRMDISYIEKWSLLLDFILILRTIKTLVEKRGAC